MIGYYAYVEVGSYLRPHGGIEEATVQDEIIAMDRPYDDIPRTGGAHHKEIEAKHSGLNVRAPRANPPEEQEKEAPASPSYQLSVNEQTGSYRVRAWREGAEEGERTDYTEVSRYATTEELASSLDDAASSLGYVVLENSDTGEVFVEQEVNLRDDWTQDGRFDQVTLFADEEDATAYANERQGE